MNFVADFEFRENPRIDNLTNYLNLDSNFEIQILKDQIRESINWPSFNFSMPISKHNSRNEMMKYPPNQFSMPNMKDNKSLR